MFLQVKFGINVWLAWLLRMQRPGKSLESVHTQCSSSKVNGCKAEKLELREYTNLASRSLMSNIRDEDDYSLPSSPQLNGHDPSHGRKVNCLLNAVAEMSASRKRSLDFLWLESDEGL